MLFAIERAGMESFNAATWMQHEQIADALGELGTVGITLGFSSPALTFFTAGNEAATLAAAGFLVTFLV